MKLEVGKRYKDQFNNVFTIISDQAKAPYNYIGQSTRGESIGFTCEGGMTYCDGRLVEEVREPPYAELPQEN